MLKSLLSPEDCAKCRYCCSFIKPTSREMPLIDADLLEGSGLLEKLQKDNPEAKFEKIIKVVDNVSHGFYKINIDNLYITNDPKEEVLCVFNKGKGCILGENKPFKCKVWPLVVMRTNNKLVIALRTDCKIIASKPFREIQSLVENGLGEKMLEYAKKFPDFIDDYREDCYILS